MPAHMQSPIKTFGESAATAPVHRYVAELPGTPCKAITLTVTVTHMPCVSQSHQWFRTIEMFPTHTWMLLLIAACACMLLSLRLQQLS